jgi:transcriptional regulator with XRE-family HTH domain
MSGRRRTQLAVEADTRNREQLARVGSVVRTARLRRRLTQAGLGARVGLSRMAISRAERGLGGGLTLDAWQRIALALGMPLTLGLQRDAAEAPLDAGHLGIQELILRHARATGRGRGLELPTKPAEPWRSIDVSLFDDQLRVLIVVECWNTIGDVGASARGSSWKAAEPTHSRPSAGGRRREVRAWCGSSGPRPATARWSPDTRRLSRHASPAAAPPGRVPSCQPPSHPRSRASSGPASTARGSGRGGSERAASKPDIT